MTHSTSHILPQRQSPTKHHTLPDDRTMNFAMMHFLAMFIVAQNVTDLVVAGPWRQYQHDRTVMPIARQSGNGRVCPPLPRLANSPPKCLCDLNITWALYRRRPPVAERDSVKPAMPSAVQTADRERWPGPSADGPRCAAVFRIRHGERRVSDIDRERRMMSARDVM